MPRTLRITGNLQPRDGFLPLGAASLNCIAPRFRLLAKRAIQIFLIELIEIDVNVQQLASNPSGRRRSISAAQARSHEPDFMNMCVLTSTEDRATMPRKAPQ